MQIKNTVRTGGIGGGGRAGGAGGGGRRKAGACCNCVAFLRIFSASSVVIALKFFCTAEHVNGTESLSTFCHSWKSENSNN